MKHTRRGISALFYSAGQYFMLRFVLSLDAKL